MIEIQNKKLTVIVCTHNRQDYIGGCIDSLLKQTVPDHYYDILVINNASDDDTQNIVSNYIKKNGNLNNIKLVHEPKIGLSNARNRGIKTSQTNYIAFIDDDARVPKNWIETALQIISEHRPDIFGGPAYPIFPSGKPDWYKDEYGVRGDMGETGWLTKGFIIGTNIFFRRDLLIEYGGFDPNLGMKGDNIGYHEETKLIHRAFAEYRKVYYSKELAVRDLIPDYKRSLAFFIYARYKSGRDRVILDSNAAIETDPIELVRQVDQLFRDFDHALMKRDIEKYPYPENYVVEKMRPMFVDMGKRIATLLKKTGYDK